MAITVKCDECGKTVKAPDSAAGKKGKCPQCGAIMKIPEPVYEAEEIDDEDSYPSPKSPSHEDPFDDVSSYDAPALPKAEKRKPCPVCGEMIVADAAKCRFCNEVFDKSLKATSKAKSGGDMTTGDWVLAILCPGIGCIVSIVWLIQGQSKGPKMLGISVLFAVFWNIVSAILQVALHQMQQQ